MQHFEIQDAVHRDLHVVAGDADLLGNIDRGFFERVFVADVIDEGEQDVEAYFSINKMVGRLNEVYKG